MIYKHGKHMRDFLGLFIFYCSLVFFIKYLDKTRILVGSLVIYYLPMGARSLTTADVRSNFPRLWKEKMPSLGHQS